MLHALQLIATLSATLFAGAALYINVVEHPSRMILDTRAAVAQWVPSYKRATLLQAPLALLSLGPEPLRGFWELMWAGLWPPFSSAS
jgi:hypothetical protein